MKVKEFLYKIKVLRKILVDINKSGIIISNYANICWLGVKRPSVLSLSENTVVKIIVTLDDIILIANNIEIYRILEEEICIELKEFFTIETFFWFDNITNIKKSNYIEDFKVEKEIKKHRIILSESDLEKSLILGKDIAEIIENTLPYIKKGKTEREISSEMIKMCLNREIEVGLVLCASEERMKLYRHPITTNTKINNVCMLALTVRRDGIYSCISRVVSLKKPTKELIEKRKAVLAIDCAFEKYTKVDENLQGVFHKIKKVYKDMGYENEWKNHHQGGVTGYNSREEKITDNTNMIIKNNMIFAYNPTIAGYKTEDTFYIKDNKKVVTTRTTKLPLIDIDFEGEKFIRPDIVTIM